MSLFTAAAIAVITLLLTSPTQAGSCSEEQLRMFEKIRGTGAVVGSILIAQCYEDQGKKKKAFREYRDAMERIENSNPTEISLVKSYDSYIEFLERIGREGEADKARKRRGELFAKYKRKFNLK